MTRTRDDATSLAEAFVAARGRWPGIALDEATFRAHVGACGDDADPPRHLEDLYLACALAHGDLAALAVFERDYLDHVPRIVGHMDQTGSLCDEVTQELRVRLLAAAQDRRPRIADYTGRADLYSWFRVSVTRTAISACRKHRREQPTSDDALIHLGGAGVDPAIAYLKATYREEFKAAFREAIAELIPRDRTLLRMHLFDDMTIDDLGAMHGVHRTTAARWLREIRDGLAAATRKKLRDRLRIDQEELDSLIRLIRSQLDVTIRGFLSEIGD